MEVLNHELDRKLPQKTLDPRSYWQCYTHYNIPSRLANSQRRESQAIFDRTAQTGTTQIDEAQSNLDRISEVRPVDIRLAEAEVNHALALLKRTETELDRAYLRAPITGQILKIHTRVGEKQHAKGIVELAQTNTMIAIAEVYPSIRVGFYGIDAPYEFGMCPRFWD